MFKIGDFDLEIIKLENGGTALSGTCRLCGKTMIRSCPESFVKPCRCHRKKPDAVVEKFEMWQRCGQNYSAAARKLGISRQAVYDAIHRYYKNVGKKRGKKDD